MFLLQIRFVDPHLDTQVSFTRRISTDLIPVTRTYGNIALQQ